MPPPYLLTLQHFADLFWCWLDQLRPLAENQWQNATKLETLVGLLGAQCVPNICLFQKIASGKFTQTKLKIKKSTYKLHIVIGQVYIISSSGFAHFGLGASASACIMGFLFSPSLYTYSQYAEVKPQASKWRSNQCLLQNFSLSLAKTVPYYIVLYMSQRYFSDMYPIIFFYNIYDMSKGHKTVQKTNKNYFFELIFPALESKLNAFN